MLKHQHVAFKGCSITKTLHKNKIMKHITGSRTRHALQDITHRLIFTGHFLSHSFLYQTSKFQNRLHIFIFVPETFQCLLSSMKNQFYSNQEGYIQEMSKERSLYNQFQFIQHSCYNKTICLYCEIHLLFTVYCVHNLLLIARAHVDQT